MTFRALYMPLSEDPPVGKGGFQTEEAAWEWVKENRICLSCKEEIAGYEAGLPEDEEKGIFYSPFPSCMCEWLVYDEDEEAEEEWNKIGGESIMPLASYKFWYKRQLELQDEQRQIHKKD